MLTPMTRIQRTHDAYGYRHSNHTQSRVSWPTDEGDTVSRNQHDS